MNREYWIKNRNSNDSLYDEVCKTGDNGSVDWTGMAKGIIVAGLPLTPLGAITNLGAILSVMSTVSVSVLFKTNFLAPSMRVNINYGNQIPPLGLMERCI